MSQACRKGITGSYRIDDFHCESGVTKAFVIRNQHASVRATSHTHKLEPTILSQLSCKKFRIVFLQPEQFPDDVQLLLGELDNICMT